MRNGTSHNSSNNKEPGDSVVGGIPSSSDQEFVAAATIDNTTKKSSPKKKSLAEEYSHVVTALEDIETRLRRKHHPELLERAPPLEVDELLLVDHPVDEDHTHGNNRNEDENSKNTNTITATLSQDGTVASLKRRKLKEVLSMDDSILPRYGMPTASPSLATLVKLDVSHNELTDLPGLSRLVNLQHLDLTRNWFNTLPSEIGRLRLLSTLVVARNFVKPNEGSLRWASLREGCPKLAVLDLSYNPKCCRPLHRDRVRDALLPLTPKISMTLWEEEEEATDAAAQKKYVGGSAGERNPRLLRSQLEPLGTVALRKRLVQDFGRSPTDPSKVDRGAVMRDLLEAYFDEGWAVLPETGIASSVHASPGSHRDANDHPIDGDSLLAHRHCLHMDGIPVPEDRQRQLLAELRAWTSHTGLVNKNRERPSISASNYMILRKPPPQTQDQATNTNDQTNGQSLSRRALRKIQKRERYRKLWDLAIATLADADPVFAHEKCTEIAVTHGFSGSPHRDKQNCGPFYGLSLGNFDDSDGKGSIVVEASARVVVRVNTKGKLGRVDGRYVHWVSPWGKSVTGKLPQNTGDKSAPSSSTQSATTTPEQRYSLIYYETGHEFVPPGPAVFSIPEESPASNAAKPG